MPKYIDADKIISHLNDEIEACGDPDVYSQPVAYGTYLGLQYARSAVETAETAEVVKEIFEEIANIIYNLRDSPFYSSSDAVDELTELKKKYTGEKEDEQIH